MAIGVPASAEVPIGSGSASTNRAGDGRTGWYEAADAPDPSVVASSAFGPLFTDALDGTIMAQPIVARGVMVVATEADQISGVDPDTGTILWQRTVGTPVPASVLSCYIVSPQVGITSTPTVDPATGIVYLMADVMVDGAPAFQLHALDPASGVEQPSFPVTISGRATNHKGARFVASTAYQRAGLLLVDGVIYAAFASHCDQAPYNGWISGVTVSGRSTGLWAAQSKNTGGGIWQSGVGLSSDGSGALYAAIGNGSPPKPAFTPSGNFGESIVRLAPSPSGLQVADVFSPASRAVQSARDYDVGSGGVVILPDAMGSTSTPHLALAQSKSGELYLLDRSHLGGVSQGPARSDDVVASTTLPGRLWATPAVGPDHLAFVESSMGYYARLDQQASAQPLYALSVGTGDHSELSVVARSAPTFGYGSGSPAVSSAPGVEGSGIVWVERCAVSRAPCSTASLDAFSSSPVDGTLAQLNSWPLPAGSKFASPLVVGGRVYLGAGSSLVAFGALGPSPLSGAFTAQGPLLAGAPATGTLTVTADAPVALVSASTSNSLLTPTLVAGSTGSRATSFSIPVTITPGEVPGEISGTATVVTTGGSLAVQMTAVTVAPGPLLLNATPAGANNELCTMLEFGGLFRGTSAVGTVPLINAGSGPLVITGITGVHAPFSVKAKALIGTTIEPGGTGALSVTAKGTGKAMSAMEIVLTTNDRPLHVLVTVASASG